MIFQRRSVLGGFAALAALPIIPAYARPAQRLRVGVNGGGMPAIAGAEPSKILVGFRPYPLDNRPIAGPVPGVKGAYAIVTHSGITLAPNLGLYAAQEVMGHGSVPILAPSRPSRYVDG